MLDRLKLGVKNIIDKVKNSIFIDRKLIEEIVKELQRSLLQADVDVELVLKLTEEIKKEVITKKTNVEKKELLIKLVHDKLIEILGSKEYNLKLEKKKNQTIMLVGLYGSGKTTSSAKIALYYKKRGFKTCMVGLDIHRPAAIEQLKQLAEKIDVPVFYEKGKDAVKIWKSIRQKIKLYDIVIIDTAGRHSLDESLVNEIKQLHKEVHPTHTLLVIPADIGKTAKTQAKKFAEVGIDGVIITRMDGSAKGGGAITSCKEANAKVMFIGTGEKLNDIETFSPTRFVSRVLGFGDLTSLIEKINLALESKDKKRLEKIKQNGFTLEDFYEQIKSMQKMGPLSKIAELIPGLGNFKIPKGMFKVQEEKLKKWKYAIDSMTPKERANPEKIDSSRIQRIAKGAHITTTEIRELLKQYKLIKQMLGKGMDEKKISRLAGRFGLKVS